ncbi:MAG: mechanosensitive ion channel family protein [Spirochaetaceae bacterium]|jgi:small-conductance mechanosensitive channel|nr:mechanosensitive ion channel family protein [Spirochaetaceae bacterium]
MDGQVITNFFSSLFAETHPAELVKRLVTIALTVLFIFVVFNLLKIITLKVTKGKLTEHRTLMLRRGILYAAWIIAVLFVFKSLGIDSSAILGAAGIAGVAIGFAAQTSMSNVISGLFLLSEKPCEVGDVITVDTTTGVVLSIDLLSVKLRTFDNLFIRIPNETIIRTNLTNITRFPIRRLEVAFTVPHRESVDRVRALLFALAEKNTFCLKNPAPLFIITGLDTNGVNIGFYIWFDKSKLLDLKNSFLESLLIAFKENDIMFSAQRVAVEGGLDAGPPYPA